jgi:hypothetical protein
MIGLGQAMFDSSEPTDPVEAMSAPASGGAFPIPGKVGEPDSVVGEHDVDAIWNYPTLSTR